MPEEEKAKPELEPESEIVIVMSSSMYAALPKPLKDRGKIMGADESIGAVAVMFKAADRDNIINELEKLNRWFFTSPSFFGG